MQTAQKISSPQSFLISDPRSWNEMFRADNRQETKDSTAVLILQIIKSGHPDTYTIREENAVISCSPERVILNDHDGAG